MKKSTPILLLVLLPLLGCVAAERGEPPVKAPFKKLDTLAVDDWWNREPSEIVDLRVPRAEVICFGIYTVDRETLKLTAQLFPLYPDESREVRLEVEKDGGWREIAREEVHDLGWSAHFRVDDWTADERVRYRLRHGEEAVFEGVVRPNPRDKDEIVVAALSCNSNKDRGMRPQIVANLLHQDPDLVFYAGDQSYDHREHTAAWLKFGLQFRETFRERPCVTIPDDHDIGQGNLWGEGGIVADSAAGDGGGYFFHPEYVRMVERCQTWHLPDPYDPEPVEQGIGVYYTAYNLGGVDFAIIEDRKFKTGPKGRIPQQGPRPDHIRNPDYDPASVDLPGLELLGDRQLAFLEDWAGDNGDVAMRAVLSQTGFCGAVHLHGSRDNRLHADLDCNGWPQSGRNRALELIRKANAVHIAGDQHLATVVQHGIDDFGDGPWAFVVPAIVNNYYGRWWWPEDEQPGANPVPDSPLPWTGDYRDGLGNRITMHAYANPGAGVETVMAWSDADLPEEVTWADGYGLIRFDKPANTVTFECWPRHTDVTNPAARHYAGWPVTVDLTTNERVRFSDLAAAAVSAGLAADDRCFFRVAIDRDPAVSYDP